MQCHGVSFAFKIPLNSSEWQKPLKFCDDQSVSSCIPKLCDLFKKSTIRFLCSFSFTTILYVFAIAITLNEVRHTHTHRQQQQKIRIHQQQQNGKLKSLSPNQQKKFLSFQSGIQRRKYKFAANFYFSFVFLYLNSLTNGANVSLWWTFTHNNNNWKSKHHYN